MSDIVQNTLSLTLAGLEAGLHVRHIAAFGLRCCCVTDDISAVCAEAALHGFDQIPVKEDGRIVGVLERQDGDIGGSIAESMHRLDDTILISADAPLARFIRLAADGPYRLVVTGAGIEGIVTRSDLLKLPVRIFAFTLVTHLESVMAAAIRTRHPNDDHWLNLLTPDRRAGILKEWKKHKRERLDPALLEFAMLADKRNILKQTYAFGEQFEAEFKEIAHLRNAIAHFNNYADSQAALQQFIARLSLTQAWIAELEGLAGASVGGDA